MKPFSCLGGDADPWAEDGEWGVGPTLWFYSVEGISATPTQIFLA